MAEKDKIVSSQPKHIPKDAQVILSIMKEVGITDYEPKTVVQLCEFVYRYATSALEEARTYANNSNKKFLDAQDVLLALQLTSEASFTTPPPREVTLECANIKNYTPLPLVKPHCGLRLPPDRHCVTSYNCVLKNQKKPKPGYMQGSNMNSKMTPKSNMSFIKRTPMGMPKPGVNIPKPSMKITNAGIQQQQQMQQKPMMKPKIQITQNIHFTPNSNGIPHMEAEVGLKRKREDDDML